LQFVFEDYSLDTDRRELWHAGVAISVGPQVFDILAFLIRNRNRVVSKDDLLEAVWNGRIVSESTLTTHINAVRKAIGDSGEEQRLIRTVARKGFRFVGDVRDAQSGAATESMHASTPALPDKPSIAVLPFQNLSGDPEQEYFADGMVEDIITALSRMRWLFVIARNSSFTYKGHAVDVKQVGRELGVRYIVEGGVRRAANKVRITAQLIDAVAGTHLWADRFEGTLDDIFKLQDQLAASVVGAIARELERAEIERATRKPTESLDAYDFFLRGMDRINRRNRDANSEALHLFHKAIESDQKFASAYGMAAWCYVSRKINRWMVDLPQEIVEGSRLARQALELANDDAVALTRGGHALAHLTGDIEAGVGPVDRALLLNPNLAIAWFLGAFLQVFRGEPDVAIERFERAARLSPLDPDMFRIQAGVALAHLIAGRFDMASSWAEKSTRDWPDFTGAVGIVAASHALAGRMDEARQAMRHLRQLDPALRLSSLRDWLPICRPEHFAMWTQGLRKAGLPE
jgi:TolB-like protein/Tfp pilus assembly protein PilF